jgi:puromycin-sensitive aminopeptidase
MIANGQLSAEIARSTDDLHLQMTTLAPEPLFLGAPSVAELDAFRLPRTVEPERYELTLKPDLETATFSGEENVRVIVHEDTDVIKCNSFELEILAAELIEDDGTKIAGTVTLDDHDTQIATIALASTARAGTATLHLTFSGILNDKLAGFYRSTYKDDEGVERVIATTQMEATDARRAFPCWDEPEFKAVFGVTLIVDDGLAAFSNGAVQESKDLGNGKRQITFDDTMKMSTYLVAFVVGPLVETDAVDVDGVPLKVACVPGREHLASFALEIGAASLRYYTNYFKIPYPGDKVDMIALPDFAFGAMENLGCITYRETALLVDSERASRVEIERVADVVSHELAHMWFGDLVTMKWWNGIWLNEAFATFMEIKGVHDFKPSWERWVSFGLERGAAMAVDSLENTRPIEFPVGNPEEARGMFDLLTYQKGGAVLRMLEQFIGEEEFREGISQYLNKHAYANAETSDLWDALEASSDQPVRSMMDTWILQGGYPIVRVERAGDYTVTISQKRFGYGDKRWDNPLWHVPVGIRYGVGGEEIEQKILLTTEQTTVAPPEGAEYMIVNSRSDGFYRVSYETELLQDLLKNVDKLDSLERFSLISDTWAACVAGDIAIADVLAVANELKTDDDPTVWGAILAPYRMLDRLVLDEQRPAFTAALRTLLQAQHAQLGWDKQPGENERASTLRAVIISALGALGEDDAIRAEAARRYQAMRAGEDALDGDLVDAVETVLASTNNHDYYEQLLAKFQDDKSTPQEQVGALQSLACFTDDRLVDRTLDMILDRTVRTQDAPYTLRTMLTRRPTGPSVWAWCEENWDTLNERFPDNSIARMIDGVTAQVDSDFADKVEKFLESHPVPQAEKMVAQSCERLRVHADFAERNAEVIPTLFLA